MGGMADNSLGELAELMPTAPSDIEKGVSTVAPLGAELRAGTRSVFFYAASRGGGGAGRWA